MIEPNATRPGDILIVDDTPANLRLLAAVLAAAGYQVRPANSGELALAAVAARPPELILLDIHMPEPDGLEVCRRLKARPESCDIPIVFISVASETAERVAGLKLGAVDFIAKPFQAEELLARVKTHLELSRLRAQLVAANRELEAFCYSVSHDLRAPLRGIDGWSLALLEDCGDQLGDQGRQYLERVRGETQRMGRLIDDLLALSRVTRTEMTRSPVDLSALCRTIAAQVQETQPGRAIEWVVQPGLTAPGDARLLEIVLRNLLDNAWKFTSKTAAARVEVGRSGGAAPAFFVRDNGAGFDQAYHGKLFGVFQRLHRASEYPGTGVGLATVQRIIQRHGGRVWAEGEIGKGATFYFTLPEG